MLCPELPVGALVIDLSGIAKVLTTVGNVASDILGAAQGIADEAVDLVNQVSTGLDDANKFIATCVQRWALTLEGG